MVSKESLIYVFAGSDNAAKDSRIKAIKEKVLSLGLQDFNLDKLYAKDLTKKSIQERILFLPLQASKRMIVIKGAGDLKEEVKNFLLEYVLKPHPSLIMILDMERISLKDQFVKGISRFAEVVLFKEEAPADTFTLSRQIEAKMAGRALAVLTSLLDNGEKPERILGGLRYSWENSMAHPLEVKQRMKLLLACDIDIKTGRLKPEFALERLVVRLCGFAKS